MPRNWQNLSHVLKSSCPKREEIQRLRSKLNLPLTKQKLFLYFLTRNEMMKSTAVGFCDLTVVFGYARHVADASWKPNTRLLHNLPLPQYPSAGSHISAASNASTMVPLSEALCTGSALSLPPIKPAFLPDVTLEKAVVTRSPIMTLLGIQNRP